MGARGAGTGPSSQVSRILADFPPTLHASVPCNVREGHSLLRKMRQNHAPARGLLPPPRCPCPPSRSSLHPPEGVPRRWLRFLAAPRTDLPPQRGTPGCLSCTRSLLLKNHHMASHPFPLTKTSPVPLAHPCCGLKCHQTAAQCPQGLGNDKKDEGETQELLPRCSWRRAGAETLAKSSI